jgi:hypothetical protein
VPQRVPDVDGRQGSQGLHRHGDRIVIAGAAGTQLLDRCCHPLRQPPPGHGRRGDGTATVEECFGPGSDLNGNGIADVNE